MARNGREVALSLLAGAFAAACGGPAGSTSGPGGNATANATNVIAVYKLDRVNSKPIPIGDGSHVFINGVQVLKDGKHTGAKPGRFVRGPGWSGWPGGGACK